MTDERSIALAETIAEALYTQLVRQAVQSKVSEWRSRDFTAGMDAQYIRIADEFSRLGPAQVDFVEDVMRRVASDTVVSVLGLINGSLDIGLDGTFRLEFGGRDVGELLQDCFLEQDVDAAAG